MSQSRTREYLLQDHKQESKRDSVQKHMQNTRQECKLALVSAQKPIQNKVQDPKQESNTGKDSIIILMEATLEDITQESALDSIQETMEDLSQDHQLESSKASIEIPMNDPIQDHNQETLEESLQTERDSTNSVKVRSNKDGMLVSVFFSQGALS